MEELGLDSLLPGKKGLESTLLLLSSGGTILEVTDRVVLELGAGRVADHAEENLHDDGADDAHAQDTDHDVVALVVLLGSLLGILRPAGVEGVGGHDTA